MVLPPGYCCKKTASHDPVSLCNRSRYLMVSATLAAEDRLPGLSIRYRRDHQPIAAITCPPPVIELAGHTIDQHRMRLGNPHRQLRQAF